MSPLATIWHITPRPALIAVTITVVAVSVLVHVPASTPSSGYEKAASQAITKARATKKASGQTTRFISSTVASDSLEAPSTSTAKQTPPHITKNNESLKAPETQDSGAIDTQSSLAKKNTAPPKTVRRWVAEKGHYVTQTISIPVREKITIVDAPETTVQIVDGTIATFPEDGKVIPGHEKDKIAKHIAKLRSQGLSGFYLVRNNIIFKTIPAVTHTEFITIMKPKTKKKWVVEKTAHWEYEDQNNDDQ